MKRAVLEHRRTFYHCICPDPPEDYTKAYLDWLVNHYSTCPPRRIVDVHLPPLEEGE